MKKLFVIQKYVWADDIPDALKKEKRTPVDDCYIDNDFKKASVEYRTPPEIGFKAKNHEPATTTIPKRETHPR